MAAMHGFMRPFLAFCLLMCRGSSILVGRRTERFRRLDGDHALGLVDLFCSENL